MLESPGVGCDSTVTAICAHREWRSLILMDLMSGEPADLERIAGGARPSEPEGLARDGKAP